MTRLKRLLGFVATVATGVTLAPRLAAAQDIEVPILVIEAPETDTGEGDDQLDLANLVTSAAKGVTTVQEAPAIITILPGDEIKDRQSRTLEDIIDMVPGFLRYGAMHNQFPFGATRGVLQSMLYMRDGVSFFDPFGNVPSIGRNAPVETIKRIEIISGPGGVLWGANSYLGVVNVITKDAEDIDGVETSFGFADGQGDKLAYRGYIMAGLTELAGRDDLKLMIHVSYENYKGPIFTRSGHMFSTPLPNPNSLMVYGPIQESDQKRSWILSFDGKLTFGKFSLYWLVPFMERNFGVGFPGSMMNENMVEDGLYVNDDPGMGLECTPITLEEAQAMGAADISGLADRCIDRNRTARNDTVNWFDRAVYLEYKTRFNSKSGMNTKLYFQQFNRHLDPLTVLPPIPGLLEGGLSFNEFTTVYRTGLSVDGDAELSGKFRVLYGLEAFHEFSNDDTVESRGGAGSQATFRGPYNLNRLPLACPRTGDWNATTDEVENSSFVPGCPQTFMFQVSRTTLGAFTAGQFRPSEKLILDGGVRAQFAPELTDNSRGYSPAFTFAGAAVYEFVPDWHLKLNYAEGFRPPVFNNTDSNGEAVEIDGKRNLLLERSRSYQAEVNARLLKGKKRIRELNLRMDVSYTTLENFIVFDGGRYANTADRGIKSAELLAKLYLKGGHRLELGYTYVDQDRADKGAFLSMPEHWFNLSATTSIIPDQLEVATVVKVYGAMEDPNRRVEARDLAFDEFGHADPTNKMQTVVTQPYELVVDRIPPTAELQVGVRWKPATFKDKLALQATVYNALNNHHYSLDAFSDLQPRLEILPSEYEAFRFFASATYDF